MAGNVTQVGIEGMVSAASNFQEAISNADRQASQVDSVGSDLQGSWKGDAATTYQSALTEWQTNWSTCRRALSEMHATLESTTSEYLSTHEETLSNANQAQSPMGNFSVLAGF